MAAKTKKTADTAAVKQLALIKNDPYLKDYENAIRGSHNAESYRAVGLWKY